MSFERMRAGPPDGFNGLLSGTNHGGKFDDAAGSGWQETKETHTGVLSGGYSSGRGAVSLPQLPSHAGGDRDQEQDRKQARRGVATGARERAINMTTGGKAYAFDRSMQSQAWKSEARGDSMNRNRSTAPAPGGGLGLGTDSAVLQALTEARLRAAPGGSLLHTLTPAGMALGGHAAAALAASGATEIMAAVERQVEGEGRRRRRGRAPEGVTRGGKYLPPGVAPPVDRATARRAAKMGVPETHPAAQVDPMDAPDLAGTGGPIAGRSGIVRTQRLAGAEVRRTARAVLLQRARAADPAKAADPAQAAAASSARRLAVTSRLPGAVRDEVAAAAEPPVPDWAQDVPLPLLLAPGRGRGLGSAGGLGKTRDLDALREPPPPGSIESEAVAGMDGHSGGAGGARKSGLPTLLRGFLSDDLQSLRSEVDLEAQSAETGAEITDVALQEIAEVAPGLTGLRLGAPGCTPVSDAGIWALARACTGLQRLELIGMKNITHVGLRAIGLRCQDLRALDLSGCRQIEDKGMRCIAGGLWELRVLRLNRLRKVMDEGVCEVMQCCRKLEDVELDETPNVSDKVLRGLAMYNPGLLRLSMKGCSFVTDGGVRDLVKGCGLLSSVHLSSCKQLTEGTVEALVEMLPRSLHTLDLSDCARVSGSTAPRKLATGCPLLKVLNLSGCLGLKASGLAWFGRPEAAESVANLRELRLGRLPDAVSTELAMELARPGLGVLSLQRAKTALRERSRHGRGGPQGDDSAPAGDAARGIIARSDVLLAALGGTQAVEEAAAGRGRVGASERGAQRRAAALREALLRDERAASGEWWAQDDEAVRGAAVVEAAARQDEREAAKEQFRFDGVEDTVGVSSEASSAGSPVQSRLAQPSLRPGALQGLRLLELSGSPRLEPRGVRSLVLAYSRLTSLVLDRCKLVKRQFLADLAEDHPFARLGRDWFGLEPLPDEALRQTLWGERKQQHYMAVRLQSWWRGEMGRTRVRDLRARLRGGRAVVQLQSRFRGSIARSFAARVRRRQQLEQSASIIARGWRAVVAAREHRRAFEEARDLRRRTLAATRLQRLWRGHVDRKVVDGIRRRIAEAAAAAARLEQRKDVAARVLQGGLRACLAKYRMKLLRDAAGQAAARIAAENVAARRIQWAWQRQKARAFMNQLRLARQEAERSRLAAIDIQCCWRSMVARAIVAKLREEKYRALKRKSAIDIQRVWRGALGRQLVAVRRAWAHLLMVEADAAMRIQTRWRSYQAKGFVAVLAAARALQGRKHAGAIGMQKIWRGVLGRDISAARAQTRADLRKEEAAIRRARERRQRGEAEVGEVPVELEGEAAIKAVVELLSDRLEKLQAERAEIDAELEELEERKTGWQAELDSLAAIRAKEVDSDKIAGTSQRYPVPWLKDRLVTALQGMEGKRTGLRARLEANQEAANETSRRLRAAQREVAPLQGKTMEWAKEHRRQRWTRWRERRAAAAAALQAGWRGAEVRAAVARGGNPWVCMQAAGGGLGSGGADDATAWYFYNPVTQASRWSTPLEYRIWGGWLPRGVVEHEEAERLAWVEVCARRRREKHAGDGGSRQDDDFAAGKGKGDGKRNGSSTSGDPDGANGDNTLHGSTSGPNAEGNDAHGATSALSGIESETGYEFALEPGAEGSGWWRGWSDEAGAYYYWHGESGEYRWVPPVGSGFDGSASGWGEGGTSGAVIGQEHTQGQDAGSGAWFEEQYSTDMAARAVSMRRFEGKRDGGEASGDVWVELYDAQSGAVWYQHEGTGESAWSLPPDAVGRVLPNVIPEGRGMQAVEGSGVEGPLPAGSTLAGVQTKPAGVVAQQGDDETITGAIDASSTGRKSVSSLETGSEAPNPAAGNSDSNEGDQGSNMSASDPSINTADSTNKLLASETDGWQMMLRIAATGPHGTPSAARCIRRGLWMYRSEMSVCPVASVIEVQEQMRQQCNAPTGPDDELTAAADLAEPGDRAGLQPQIVPRDPKGIPSRGLARLRAVDSCEKAYPDRLAHLALMREAVDLGRWPDVGQLSALMVRRQRAATDDAQRRDIHAAARRAGRAIEESSGRAGVEVPLMRGEDWDVIRVGEQSASGGDGGVGNSTNQAQVDGSLHVGEFGKRFELAALVGADYWHGAMRGRRGWTGARWAD